MLNSIFLFQMICFDVFQYSFGSFGTGLLNKNHLSYGGLVFPNDDGSGPQANNLAAAIYGVAIPPGFGQFSASENYFGHNPYNGNNSPKPADLLIGTGFCFLLLLYTFDSDFSQIFLYFNEATLVYF